MERRSTEQIVKYYLEKIKEWRNELIDDETDLYDNGYIDIDDDYYYESDKIPCRIGNIVVHYSIDGQQLMTDMLVSMISKELDIDSFETSLADVINDYVIGELTLNSAYILLQEFAIMGNDCTTEEVNNWDKLYEKLKERDNK